MRALAVIALVTLAVSCGHSTGSPPTSVPTFSAESVPNCLNLGPDGDAGAQLGSCGNVYTDGSGNACAVCFYDQGCLTPLGVYCVNGSACDDRVCTTSKARKARITGSPKP